jgi:death on curing protein
VPNLSLVESAIARPYSGYHRGINEKAAALVQSMAGNHGFADGNKRTTLILLYTLLTRSGYSLNPKTEEEDINEATEEMILGVATGAKSFVEIKQWFAERTRRLSPAVLAFLRKRYTHD